MHSKCCSYLSLLFPKGGRKPYFSSVPPTLSPDNNLWTPSVLQRRYSRALPLGKTKEQTLDQGSWRRKWQPTPVFLPGKSHGQRSLMGYNPWGCEESDTTERLHFHFSFSCIGEGSGNPLQYSCLETPRYEGAWWAAAYGVAQSQTRLKWLSSMVLDLLKCSSEPWISVVS